MFYQPEYAEQARNLCRLGATDEELAEHFEVCVRTIYRWRNAHEEFAEAVIAGKEHADARVERALYSRAVGCRVERVKVFRHAGDPDPVYARYQVDLAPDVNAALQWLRARQPRKWRMAAKEDPSKPNPAEMIERALARMADYKTPYPTPPRPGAAPGTPPPAPPEKMPAPFYAPVNPPPQAWPDG
jgi:hypothetical protein